MSASTADVRAEDLAELLDKYRSILHLRRNETGDPRHEMRRLARRFPGALRELDDLPLPVLVAREEALRAASDDPSRIERWMEACVLFHRWMRGALAAKRWLRAHSIDDGDVLLQSGDTEAALWADRLSSIHRPPRGRLSHVVLGVVAARMHLTQDDVRELIFGPPRRSVKS